MTFSQEHTSTRYLIQHHCPFVLKPDLPSYLFELVRIFLCLSNTVVSMVVVHVPPSHANSNGFCQLIIRLRSLRDCVCSLLMFTI